MGKIMLKGTKFVNESGWEIILHGVNVLCREACLGVLIYACINRKKLSGMKQRMELNVLLFWKWHKFT